MPKLLTIIFILFALSAIGQGKFNGTVKGLAYNSLTNTGLQGATVVVLNRTDSSTAAYTTTDSLGFFQMQQLDAGAYILGISFTGFAEYIYDFALTAATPVLDVNTIMMQPDTNTLEGVVVSRPPVTIRGDTVEFRASAFVTPPNATVEALLKKLPGLEVDRDGNITSQGEEITRVFVDGKEFFTNDPKLATQNLTAEMVESIQVFDDMGDQARFTNIDDGSRTRTINIKLKKDRRKGIFGRATAGMGSSERYTGNGSVNMFNEDRQLSILGGANNINRLGFTQNDIDRSLNNNNNRNSRGGGGGNTRTPGIGPNGDGNTKSWSAGLNFRGNLGTKATIGGSYFVSETDRDVQSSRARQNFFPNDSLSFTNSESVNGSVAANHNINLRIEYKIDSMNSILITPRLNWGNASTLAYDSVSTTASGKLGEYLAIVGNNRRSSYRTNHNIGNNLLFRHRFAKPGRTFTIGWNTSIGATETEGLNELPYIFYRSDGSIRRIQDVKQQNDQLSNSFNNTVSTSFTEMLGVGKIFELNYAYSNNQSISDRITNDFNAFTGKFDSLNKPLTNYFENSFISSRVGTNFRVKKEKYDYQMGGAVQFASLENMSRRAILDKDTTMAQKFVNFFPNASFNYNLGTRQSLRVQYRGSTRAPNINQLQDVLDISNPQRLRTGNPDLKQEFSNNLNVSLNTFNTKTFLFFNTNIQGSIISNRIVNSIDTVSATVQIIKPENVNGAQNLSLSSTLGIPLKKVTNCRRSPMNLNLTTNLRGSREVSLLFKQINFNYNYTIGQRVAFNYSIDRKLDLNANVNLTYNESKYSVQENLNNKFLNHRYGLDVTGYFFKRLSVNSDFDLAVNSGRADGFNQTIPIWNTSVAWLFFKKSNGELKFSVVDMLNLNKSINRNIGDNFIDDSFVNVLQRYFLVTFMINLNKFGGRGAAAPPRGGVTPGGERMRTPGARPTGGGGGGRSRS